MFSVLAFGQVPKATMESVNLEQTKDTARYYYYYSPRFLSLDIDYDRWDVWYTYVIDSTYYPGTERFPDGTYKRWKRDHLGRLLTVCVIAPKSMREIFLSDTARYLPHWMGEIPRQNE